MPIYEYKCPCCNNKIETIQSVSYIRKPACTICGSIMNRLYAPVVTIFKGSGFYTTDYKKKQGEDT
jgi:putative FmdB family regulatory protein